MGSEKENDEMELILKGAPGELFTFQSVQKAPTEEPSCTPKTQSEQYKDMIEVLELRISELKNERQLFQDMMSMAKYYLSISKDKNMSIGDITKFLEDNIPRFEKKEQTLKEEIAAWERRIFQLKNGVDLPLQKSDTLELLMSGYIEKGPLKNTLRYFGYEEDSKKAECCNHWSKYEYLEKLFGLPKTIHAYLKDKKFKLVFDYDPDYPNTLIQIFRE